MIKQPEPLIVKELVYWQHDNWTVYSSQTNKSGTKLVFLAVNYYGTYQVYTYNLDEKGCRVGGANHLFIGDIEIKAVKSFNQALEKE